MTSTAEWAARMDGVLRRAGLTVTLRRRNSLRNGATGAPLGSLRLRGAVLAGATLLSLDAPNLEGILEQGAQLTIAGVAGTYAVAAPATAEAGVLASVAVSPALAGPAADDAVAAITRSYGDFNFVAARENVEVVDRDRTVIGMRAYVLSAVGAPIVPRTGDLLLESDTESAVEVEEWGPGGAAGWRLKVSA